MNKTVFPQDGQHCQLLDKLPQSAARAETASGVVEPMRTILRCILGLAVGSLVVILPVVFFRYEYGDSKRLREVVPGVLYRSGQMTAVGLAAAARHYGIRTVVNVQDDYPDPTLWRSFLDRRLVPESEVCRQLGIHYLFLQPELISRRRIPTDRPTAIDR